MRVRVAQAPTPPVAVAMELIRSQLYSGKYQDGWLHAAESRFSKEHFMKAFSHLQTMQHVYPGSARRPYQLVDKFRHNLQVSLSHAG